MKQWKEINFWMWTLEKFWKGVTLRSHEFTLESVVLHVVCGKYALEIGQDCIVTLKMNMSLWRILEWDIMQENLLAAIY
jgi:hypothetical protein